MNSPPQAMVSNQKSPKSTAKSRWLHADVEQRRRLIVAVAMQLLHRRGPQAMTMRRVAQRLGLGAMTIYTYVAGQEGLRRAIVQRGFQMLQQGCESASTLGTDLGWWGGARHYLQFALDNPNLYRLMFSLPTTAADADEQMFRGEFQKFLDKVRKQAAPEGLTPQELEARARRDAGRLWIALHGLASLAIDGRLSPLGGDLDQLLRDILERAAPQWTMARP
jgi:AcrR family transcriptional regulator